MYRSSARTLVLQSLKQRDPDAAVVDLRHLGDRLGFLSFDHGADAHLTREVVWVEGRLGEEPDDVERGRPGDLDRGNDLAAEALDDRRHAHDGGDTDHDAEDCQGGPQLVGPDGRNGEGGSLDDGD
jgi:hypothetical protein